MSKPRVVKVLVTHQPHRATRTGRRFETLRFATIRVEAVLDDGTTRLVQEYSTPETGVMVSRKIAVAQEKYNRAIGNTWEDVQRVDFRNLDPALGVDFSASSIPRWFRCGCGAVIKVSKEDWRNYSSGDRIQVHCGNCLSTGAASLVSDAHSVAQS